MCSINKPVTGLKKLEMNRRKARQAGYTKRWRLYEKETGRIPKGLLEMFAPILREIPYYQKQSLPDDSVLTPTELEHLRQCLKCINEQGAGCFVVGSVVSVKKGQRKPVIKKIRGRPFKKIFELKIASGRHNPRLMFCHCRGELSIVTFLHAFKKKSQGLPKLDKERTRLAFEDWSSRGECL